MMGPMVAGGLAGAALTGHLSPVSVVPLLMGGLLQSRE